MLKRLLFASLAYALAAPPAHASFLSGEALDTAADIIAIVVLFLVPVVGIVVFWMVHVLPEKIAEKRHHPQTDAIHTLCLLSLVFGGLLWPLAWLWALHQAGRLPDGLRHRQARGLLPRAWREAPRGQAAARRGSTTCARSSTRWRRSGALPPN